MMPVTLNWVQSSVKMTNQLFSILKSSLTQAGYTTTECELLAIIETLKEFKNILPCQDIIIYTDHWNLLAKNCTIECILWWYLLIEEFSPQFHYILGQQNIVADTLSNLDMTDTNYSVTQNEELLSMSAEEIPQTPCLCLSITSSHYSNPSKTGCCLPGSSQACSCLSVWIFQRAIHIHLANFFATT